MSATAFDYPALVPLNVDFAIDPETGEIVAVKGHEDFVADSEQKVEWVLGQFLNVDAQIEAVDGSEIVEQARRIVANADAKKKQLASMRKALEWRFLADLEAWAKANAPKGTKTWRGLMGAVSIRKKAAKVVVTDEAEAIRTLEKMGAIDAIKKSIWLSKLPEGIADREGFAIEPESETVMVKTGAGVEK